MKLRKSLLGKSRRYLVRRVAAQAAVFNRVCQVKTLRERLVTARGVYLILDRSKLNKFSLTEIKNLVSGRAIGLVQLRDKTSAKAEVLKFAVKLAKQVAQTKSLFIVNDYVDVAVKSNADGVHLGQDDLALKQARKILGQDKIIGISCHSLAQALKAQKEGADYIGFGPIYATATKPELAGIGLKVAAQLKTKIHIPCFAIGNINQSNVKKITACGFERIAVCRAILEDRSPQCAAKRLFQKLRKHDTA